MNFMGYGLWTMGYGLWAISEAIMGCIGYYHGLWVTIPHLIILYGLKNFCHTICFSLSPHYYYGLLSWLLSFHCLSL
jgi:hypothetical protein